MVRKLRVLAGVFVFVLSVFLLIWGLTPAKRETRIQNISPSEMQLPTPVSLLSDPWAVL